MKKVYIPTMEEILCINNNINGGAYNFLLNKTIEAMIMADVIYEEEDMFDVAYDKFPEYPEILYSIAKMYPEKIKEHERARNDIDLCVKLIPALKQQNKSIYGLDGMTQFSDSVLQNPNVIRQTIKTLSEQLQNNPRYRFEYFGPNQILDDIFARDINIDTIYPELAAAITYIEPAYFPKLYYTLMKTKKNNQRLYYQLHDSVVNYSFRYGINGSGYKIEDEKTKKLIRHLDEHKNNYQF